MHDIDQHLIRNLVASLHAQDGDTSHAILIFLPTYRTLEHQHELLLASGARAGINCSRQLLLAVRCAWRGEGTAAVCRRVLALPACPPAHLPSPVQPTCPCPRHCRALCPRPAPGHLCAALLH